MTSVAEHGAPGPVGQLRERLQRGADLPVLVGVKPSVHGRDERVDRQQHRADAADLDLERAAVGGQGEAHLQVAVGDDIGPVPGPGRRRPR
jgi:hypothetical protein